MKVQDFTILDAMDAKEIWGGWFRNPKTWGPWRAFLACMFGLPLSKADRALFKQCAGRSAVPAAGFTEAWLICGRRAGKSFVLALIACFLAVFRDWAPYLSPGEIGTIKIIATDRKQARVIHRYCRALLKVPAFRELVDRDDDDEIVLTNGITIEIQTASFRSVRGFTLIAALCDETAFWRNDEYGANPDSEIINALRPAMATIPGAFFLAASSPYARRGELWNAFRRWHGHDEAPALVWRADTRTMNETVPQSLIDKALEEDPAKAGAEYLAEFRTDVETFVDREVVDAAVVPDRYELPPVTGTFYHAFMDPSGGSGTDSMTLCVTHQGSAGNMVVDAVRERRPKFSPASVVSEFTGLLRYYGVREVVGDNFGGEWPREQFAEAGINYVVSKKTKFILYTEFLPLLNSGRVELLDHLRTTAQLCGLERRAGRGRDVIDHAPGGHDDLINAVAGAAVLAATVSQPLIISDETLRRSRLPASSTSRYSDPRNIPMFL